MVDVEQQIRLRDGASRDYDGAAAKCLTRSKDREQQERDRRDNFIMNLYVF